jgi:Gpi18-like mannosyltransferase
VQTTLPSPGPDRAPAGPPAAASPRPPPLAQAIALLALLFALLAFTVPSGGYDMEWWLDWSARLARGGIGHVYDRGGVNYPPMWLELLAGVTALAGGPISPARTFTVKLVPLAFDLAIGIALAVWLARRGRDPHRALFVSLNLALVYDAWVWGQIDAIHSFFVLAAALLLLEERPVLAAVAAALAVGTKLQAVVFAPFLLLAFACVAGRRWRVWVGAAAAVAGAAAMVLAPFAAAGRLSAPFRGAVSGLDFYPAVSLNAANLWYLLVGDPYNTSDAIRFLGISCKLWGLGLLALALGAVVLPWWRVIAARRRAGAPGLPAAETLLALALVGIAFFWFPTQMHERYLHPGVLLLGAYAVASGRWAAYAVLSSAYLLNLERVQRFRGFTKYGVQIFDPQLIALAVLAVFAHGLWRLWRAARIGSADA